MVSIRVLAVCIYLGAGLGRPHLPTPAPPAVKVDNPPSAHSPSSSRQARLPFAIGTTKQLSGADSRNSERMRYRGAFTVLSTALTLTTGYYASPAASPSISVRAAGTKNFGVTIGATPTVTVRELQRILGL